MSRKVTTISDSIAKERCLRNIVKDQLKRIKELKAENERLKQHLKDNTKQVRKEVCDDLCNEIEFIWGIHQEITITHIRDILRSYAERIEKGK